MKRRDPYEKDDLTEGIAAWSLLGLVALAVAAAIAHACGRG